MQAQRARARKDNPGTTGKVGRAQNTFLVVARLNFTQFACNLFYRKEDKVVSYASFKYKPGHTQTLTGLKLSELTQNDVFARDLSGNHRSRAINLSKKCY